jgi:Domain of Unknown Function (DUF1080)
VIRSALTIALACIAVPAGRGADPTAGFTLLFNGKDLAGWKTFLDPKAKDADPNKVWTVEDGEIHCLGKPLCYLLTEKEYGDYVLRVQWRWPKEPGNSGVFVHVSGPDKIWPKGVEAQLQSGQAGDFWLVDGFKLTVPEAKDRQDPRSPRHFLRIGESYQSAGPQNRPVPVRKQFEKPAGEWNQYEITCEGDTIKLLVNGRHVNTGTHAEAARGHILLQSEGAPVQFRNVEIKSLK